MKHFISKTLAVCLLFALLLSCAPNSFASETTVSPVANDDLKHSGEKILGYWINPSNFTISNTNIDNLVNVFQTLYPVIRQRFLQGTVEVL